MSLKKAWALRSSMVKESDADPEPSLSSGLNFSIFEIRSCASSGTESEK